MRHDFCSRLVQAGQPLHVVAELAGRTNIATTLCSLKSGGQTPGHRCAFRIR
ncbi:MAG: hypothetical protein ACE5GQ_11450 [Nitrospinales bacterium]